MENMTPTSQQPVVHRITAANDIEAIVTEINAATWDAANEIVPYTVASLERYVAAANTHFLTVTINDAFAGMASAVVLAKPHSVGPWLYVDEVDVAVPWRRKGAGRALMTTLIDIGSDNRCTEVWLGTEPDNAAAMALYDALEPDERMAFVGFTYETQ